MSETMKKIQLLQSGMINKIAAGEVVENPVSVVKELVENSIDAQASSVTVEIKDGGTTFIRVTDNGVGIPRDQVKTAFLRHATSKIWDMEDLWNVMSLGFRGEALSSISSVANVEMVTKTAMDLTGYRIEMEDGQVMSESETGAASGTSVVVRNLFYNVPARKKFLKKTSVEAGYISEMVNRLALGHPDVAFKFINNSSIILQTRGNNDPKEAILQVYGKEVFKNLIDVKYARDSFKISGFIGKPAIARGNRNYENFFINGRYVKSELARSAVEDAYKTKLLTGKFPIFVIYIDIPPTLLDVNVHPAKTEVRFSDENMIYTGIFDAVTKALKDSPLIPGTKWGADKEPSAPLKFSLASDMPPAPTAQVQTIFETIPERETSREPESKQNLESFNGEKEFHYRRETPFKSSALKLSEAAYTPGTTVREAVAHIPEATVKTRSKIFDDYTIVGQIFGTYWIVQQGDKIYLIDQHAAHERILYEEIIEGLKDKKIAAQKLLQPLLVKLSVSEEQTVKDNLEIINEFGFEVEQFGDGTYALRSVPYIIKGSLSAADFTELVDGLSNAGASVSSIYEAKTDALATVACKAAVKANDRLSYPEAKALIERMMKLENPFTCPHGRPTVIEMSRYELEKKFLRV